MTPEHVPHPCADAQGLPREGGRGWEGGGSGGPADRAGAGTTRRVFLTTAAVAGVAATAGGGRAAPPAPPWFDASFAELPPPDRQTRGLSAAAAAAQSEPREAAGLPVTGLPVDVGPHDREIAELVKRGGLVGVSYAIAVDRELKVARGIGHLSSHDRVAAAPTSPGYVGSITKPLCVMTALTLVRAGKLGLDRRVADVLPLTPLLKDGEARQPEIDRVTVRMLMNHTSGLFNGVEELYDRAYYRRLAGEGKLHLVHGDISQYDLVRRGMAKPFVSQPGAEFHYSGQGLQVLGRVIETLTGERLDKAMSARALAPLGVPRHATLSYLDRRAAAQIAAGQAVRTGTFIPSPFDEAAKACRSWAYAAAPERLYGGHWGNADACGSSMLSAVDLLRFVTFCPTLLGKELTAEALAPPKTAPYSNGLGWGVGVTRGRHQFGHGGAIDGARAFCESTWDGVQYAVLVAGDRDAEVTKINAIVRDVGRSLRKAKQDVGGWAAYGFA